MVRSSVPVRQFPIGDPPPFRKQKFPVTQFSNVIKGRSKSHSHNLPHKGQIVAVDLGAGQMMTGEILDYFDIQGNEYVQIKAGNNIYLRLSSSVKK